MSQFQATRCDECQRIQGEANHWIQIEVWNVAKGGFAGISMGDIKGSLISAGLYTDALPEIRDLCGQGCAIRHIAKLLGWSSVLEAQKD